MEMSAHMILNTSVCAKMDSNGINVECVFLVIKLMMIHRVRAPIHADRIRIWNGNVSTHVMSRPVTTILNYHLHHAKQIAFMDVIVTATKIFGGMEQLVLKVTIVEAKFRHSTETTTMCT